jgi:hypothetical protein
MQDDEEVNQIVLEEILTCAGYQFARCVNSGCGTVSGFCQPRKSLQTCSHSNVLIQVKILEHDYIWLGWGWYSGYEQGWPESYIYTVLDQIFGDFPAKNTVFTLYI